MGIGPMALSSGQVPPGHDLGERSPCEILQRAVGRIVVSVEHEMVRAGSWANESLKHQMRDNTLPRLLFDGEHHGESKARMATGDS